MSEAERLIKVMEEARKEVEDWPDWKKNQEPPPGRSSRDWIFPKEKSGDCEEE